jgi:Domain of unknown function (DUF4386)
MTTETIETPPKAAEWSPRFKARLAGVIILIEGLSSVFGQLRIPGQFLVTSDAAATAANILSNETLFRLGATLALISVAFHIAWVVLFYDLFKPVNRTLSLLAAFVGLIAIALQAVSAIFQSAPLTILRGGEFSSAFTVEQLQALAYLALRLQGQTFNMYMVFFGIWCLLTGYLIFRSGFMPRLVGLLEMLAGAAYLILLWPPLASALHPYYLFFGVGELFLLLWLLVKGVDSARWHERAGALNRAFSEN